MDERRCIHDVLGGYDAYAHTLEGSAAELVRSFRAHPQRNDKTIRFKLECFSRAEADLVRDALTAEERERSFVSWLVFPDRK